MLWKNIFYGPVLSRRLGHSLGVNLMPRKRKICNFNCIYCECGLNDNTNPKESLPSLDDFNLAIEETLLDLLSKNQKLDHITFSGNGEPTLHPDFDKIIESTIRNRNKYFPNCKIAVLTNSTNVHHKKIFDSLIKIDIAICKLDSGSDHLFRLIDDPVSKIALDEITNNLSNFEGKIIIQSIFLRGTINGESVDNTTSSELEKYLNRLKLIKPKSVMIYSLDRIAPYSTIEKISKEELEQIAEIIRNNGFNVDYYS